LLGYILEQPRLREHATNATDASTSGLAVPHRR
jgi:hypothetical protein